MKNYNTFILEKNIPVNMDLPDDIIKIAQAYHSNNKDLFVVGGAVRDFLSGKIPHDFDLVTDALPEESKKILKDFKVSDEQGKNFGVLRVYTEDEPLGYEIAVYRKDISGGRDVKGDDKKVEFGKNIGMIEDSKRRDLTINALYYDIVNKQIIDLVGGVDDLKNNIIRSVGSPFQRFNEDRLRILRVIRFSARTGAKIDKITSEAIKKDNRLKGIGPKDDVSQERILQEWNKTLEHAEKGGINIMQRYIDLLTEYNMWEQMFPKLNIDTNLKIRSLKNEIIFADLLKNNDIHKLKKYIVEGLKFPIELYNNIYFLHELDKIKNPENAFYLANLKQRFNIDDNLIREYYVSDIEPFLKYCNDGFEIDGNDLMEQGFKGSEIAKEKERLENLRYKNNYL